MPMLTVTIRETGASGRSWSSAHRTDDPTVALDRAIRKVWGRGASWFPDHGLCHGPLGSSTHYGQIMRWVAVSQYSSITGRVSVKID